MALESIGLGSVFTANTKPMVQNVGRARDAMGRFVGTADKIPPHLNKVQRSFFKVGMAAKALGAGVASGLTKIGAGISSLTMALLPAGLALGWGVKKAAAFEKQMSGVGAVSRASTSEMSAMADEARRMGIVSAFSATQAAEGMENLARAGAKPTEIIEGLSGVMNAAAADGISLATSADIVAQVVKGMGMEWNEAGHVADTLALASASANTDIVGLGEAFKMGVATAKQLNLPLEETTAILGKLADSGLKGTMGGTAFSNMMTKMAAPSEKATTLLKKWGVQLTHLSGSKKGSLKSVSTIVQDVSRHINKLGKVTDKVAAAKEIFGLRGARAYNALAVAGKAATDQLTGALTASSNGIGAAQEMADKRLDNLMGKLTLLGSSMEGLMESIFGPALSGFQSTIRDITTNLNNVIFAIKDLDTALQDGGMSMYTLNQLEEKYGKTTVQVAMGIRDAIDMIKEGWKTVTETVANLSKSFKERFGGDAVRSVTKLVIVITTLAGVLAPLMLGFMAAKMAIGGIITIVSGLWTVVSAVVTAIAPLFWPILAVVAALGLAFALVRQENETFMETVTRVWGATKAWILDVWENAIKPLWQGIQEGFIPAIESIGIMWNHIIVQIKAAWAELTESFSTSSTGMIIDWQKVGRYIGIVFSTIIKVGLFAVESLVRAFKVLTMPIKAILQTVHNIAAAFGTMAGGNVLEGFKRLGLAILDFVLLPIRTIIKGIIELANLTGAINWLPKGVAAGMKDFAEKGTTDAFFPKLKTAGAESKGKGKVKLKSAEEKGKYGAMGTDQELAMEYGIGTGADMADAQAAQAIIDTEAFKSAQSKSQHEELKAAMDKMGNKKTEVEINNKMCVNGEDLNIASAKHKATVKERSGGMPQWQYGPMHDHGVEV